ncbi:dynamin family protein [Nonomuraea zeae]|uniref:Dynamin N-terminal domain-containing protein n=1 Tax=Nonomuraea zeae TaxID=1642303 RepID=A0A5S4G920_9ACTN|nr:dynamin family protein [Nonomuraea zeae]TMR29515.1 hypothetical protein ETD85_32205 [Nonomuraea zeae]
MESFDRLRDLTIALADDVHAAALAQEAGEVAARVAAARRRLSEGHLTVLTCGEFKRGKSSLLNALLDEPGLLPADNFYATRLVTTIRYGETERITVALPGGEKEISRAEIAQYAAEGGDGRPAVTVAIELPSPRLAPGYLLADTPGVGGVYTEHTAVTMAFLPQADALLFVADAGQPLLDSELDFLTRAGEALRATGDPGALVAALTKIDLVPDYTELLADTKAKLARATGLPPELIPLIPVSSHAKLAYLDTGDPEALELSNFPAFEKVLWDTLRRRRGPVLLGGALRDLSSALTALSGPVLAELRYLRAGTESELTSIRAELAERRQRLVTLAGEGAAWRAELGGQLTRVAGELRRRAASELATIWQRVASRYLYEERLLANPELLVGEIVTDVATTVGVLNSLAERETARVLRDFTLTHDIALHDPRFDRLPDPPVPRPDFDGLTTISPSRLALDEVTVVAGTGATLGGGIGSGVGFAIGTLLGGAAAVPGMYIGAAVGSAIGVLISGLGAYRSAAERREGEAAEIRRRRIMEELSTLRSAQEMHVGEVLTELMEKYTQAAVHELNSRIAQDAEEAEATGLRLEGAIAATEKESAEREAVLVADAGRYAGLTARLESLTATVTDSPASSPAAAPADSPAASPAATPAGSPADGVAG